MKSKLIMKIEMAGKQYQYEEWEFEEAYELFILFSNFAWVLARKEKEAK